MGLCFVFPSIFRALCFYLLILEKFVYLFLFVKCQESTQR